MIKEHSAGGIVYKREGIKEKKVRILWLVARHSMHKGWVFPKGFIGDHIKGETMEETALREVKEETGVEARIIEPLQKEASYYYSWQGVKRFKKVNYYLMEYKGGDINDHDFEMSDVVWLAKPKVNKILTYNSDKKAFLEALGIFRRLEKEGKIK